MELVPVGTFASPIYVTVALGDASRVYVVERAGVIKVVKDGQPSAFVDLSQDVSGVNGERGLLSVAFGPDFATSRRLYVHLTAKASGTGAAGDLLIARVTARDGDSADPATFEPLVRVPHGLRSNHNGGPLQFGPDGMLYAATGDGGAGGDPAGNGQLLSPGGPASLNGVDRSPLLGKALRLDVSPTAVAGPRPWPTWSRRRSGSPPARRSGRPGPAGCAWWSPATRPAR